jgi:glycine cleavage system protein P-like pyridoxal-binding family
VSDTITIFERSREGRRAFVAPEAGVPEVPVEQLLPSSQRRERPAELPEVSEPELVRHYVTLSSKNFHLDEGFYPLGSCTMKHNPKLHERVASLPGHARLHPLQDPEYAQGALELMWQLQRALAEIAGLPHVSLQPSAGSHGELTGLLLTRAYHEDHGERRTKVLTPDTAHGTNPATVTMAGYQVVKVGTADDGGVDVDDLRAKTDDDVACLMLTNPNTLGLFDRNIEEIAGVVHDAGATLYYDGANLNAVMGIARPGDMGFDIVHFNLHKTFTQPHGGGGPGAGPIAVSNRIEPFLPAPQVVRADDGSFDLDHDRPRSIGKLRGFQGNFGVFVRSYAYICSLGGDGLGGGGVGLAVVGEDGARGPQPRPDPLRLHPGVAPVVGLHHHLADGGVDHQGDPLGAVGAVLVAGAVEDHGADPARRGVGHDHLHLALDPQAGDLAPRVDVQRLHLQVLPVPHLHAGDVDVEARAGAGVGGDVPSQVGHGFLSRGCRRGWMMCSGSCCVPLLGTPFPSDPRFSPRFTSRVWSRLDAEALGRRRGSFLERPSCPCGLRGPEHALNLADGHQLAFPSPIISQLRPPPCLRFV